MQKGVEEFLRKVKEMGFKTKLDTNGTKPQYLKEILSSGVVDYVAMDIKNSPARYAETVGVKAFSLKPVYESIDIIRSSGVEYEFRTTLMSSHPANRKNQHYCCDKCRRNGEK